MNEKLISISTSVIKAGVAIIPWAGGPISCIIGDISQERYNKRFSEFIEKLNLDLSCKINQINKDKVSSDDFKDIFVNTLNDVLKNRCKEKRTALANVLINSILDISFTFDEAEYMSKLINDLTIKHFVVLNLIKDFSIEEQKEEETAVNIISEIKNKYSINESEAIELINDLENEYLVIGLSINYHPPNEFPKGGLLYTGFETYITDKGKRLLEVVKMF